MANPGWESNDSPFHQGELAIQARRGIQERIDRQGRRIIRKYLSDQHRNFFAQLVYVIVGSLDRSGDPWASILVGESGFISTPSDRAVEINTKLLPGDPLRNNLAIGANLGVLGIELQTRRRNRLNGVVSEVIAQDDRYQFAIEVKQSFGNCPQYIQAREFEFVKLRASSSTQQEKLLSFGKSAQNLIVKADTFFIASAYLLASAANVGGVDVSHRGGKPGFIRIDDEKTLTIPDFPGNGHFNTLGNLELNPCAGLLFIDFEQGDLLYLTGTTEVIWSAEEVRYFSGAEQLIRFHLKHGYWVKASLPLRWSAPEFSPFLQKTGSW